MGFPSRAAQVLAAGAVLVLAGCAVPAAPVAGGPTAPPSSDSPTPTATPTPEPVNPSHLPAATAVDYTAYVFPEFHDGPEWVSPSGNLQCAIHGDPDYYWKAGCVAAEHSWEYPPCDSEVCSAFTGLDQAGQVQVFRRGGAEFVGEGFGYTANVLPYGSSISFAGVTCVSTEDGMYCEDQATFHGFLMSKVAHDWF